MKLMKKANIYQASNYNVTFNPVTLEAHSYKWWKFVAKIDGLVIFNNYRYSVSTSKHQAKVRSLLATLGVNIDIEMPLPEGINSNDFVSLIVKSEEHLCNKFLSQKLKAQDKYQERKAKLAEKSLMSRAIDKHLDQTFNEMKEI